MTVDAVPSRLNQIDIMRGLASLAVCWFHLTNSYSTDSPARISGGYGWLGIEVFFVISGFVIPYAMHRAGYKTSKDWYIFICKRIVRIDPPYLVAALMTLLLWYASAMAPGFQGQAPSPSIAELLLHLGYLNGIAGYPWLNPVFWTLAIEFQYYLLISLVFGSLSSGRRFLRWPVICVFLVLPFFFHTDTYVFRFTSLFMLGIAAFLYRVNIVGKVETAFVFTIAAISSWVTLGMAATLAGLITAILICLDWKPCRAKPLLFLGTISYSLYLLHVPIGGRVVNLGRRFVDSPLEEWLLSAFALLVSLICAGIFWKLVERPAQEWASRWKYQA